MRLKKIPYDDFHTYISERLNPVLAEQSESVADEILAITKCHPYYTQQLSSQVWELANYESVNDGVVETAVERLSDIHDLDFERLWVGFNKVDRRVLKALCADVVNLSSSELPTSTTYSAVKRLMQKGFVIKEDTYQIEDPFFKRWIVKNQL